MYMICIKWTMQCQFGLSHDPQSIRNMLMETKKPKQLLQMDKQKRTFDFLL